MANKAATPKLIAPGTSLPPSLTAFTHDGTRKYWPFFETPTTLPMSLSTIYIALTGVTAASATILALHFIFTCSQSILNGQRLDPKDPNNIPTTSLSYRSLRSCCSVLLFASSIISMSSADCEAYREQKMWKCVIFGYAALLALAAVGSSSSKKWSSIFSIHLEVVLLSSLLLYGYTTILPILLPATRFPNLCESKFQLWLEGIALAFAAIVLPMLAPRRYIPTDTKNPASTLHPEKTASLLSLLFFSYLDSLIFKAAKVPHLSTNELPLLSEEDQARVLRERNLSAIDPLAKGGKRHVFFNLLHIFRWDVLSMGIALIFQAVFFFVPTIASNQLLVYLEHIDSRNGSTNTPPWFWILLLFIGPVGSSTAMEVYMRTVSRAHVIMQSLLTQVIYEHSLKARLQFNTKDNSVGNDKASDESSKSTTLNVNTLVTVDLNTIEQGQHFLILGVWLPFQMVICIAFLYKLLGWSSFIGIVLTILMVPIPSVVGKSFQGVQERKMKQTDTRVQMFSDGEDPSFLTFISILSLTEGTVVVNVLRMVKLFGWEQKMAERIARERHTELRAVRKARLLDLLMTVTSFALPFVTMLATFACYVRKYCILSREFSPSVAFPSMVVFDLFRNQIQVAFMHISRFITAKVSLDRINDFLQSTELLDAFENDSPSPVVSDLGAQNKVGFHNASFTWSTGKTLGRRFVLKVTGGLCFEHNALNLVIGPTGSGKTSLILALLGEMNYTPLSADAWFHLPRSGGVAYAAQESWVINETIRENILFGSAYDEARYKTVIRQCALEHDLSLFSAGDMTEIGERGLTLSGGQKARLTLARAVYSQAEILLLDDILAALEYAPHFRRGTMISNSREYHSVHTSKWIVQECLSGDLVKGRTVVIVSHNIALLAPLAHTLVQLRDGTATSINNVDAYLEHHSEAPSEAVAASRRSEPLEQKDDGSYGGKLILSEEVHQGGVVGWPAAVRHQLGWEASLLFFASFFACLVISHFTGVVQSWYLGYWASKYEDHTPSEVSSLRYLVVYGLIFLLWLIVLTSAHVQFILASIRASESIHNRLVESVLAATFRWLDETPLSRIITRSTQDIGSVDVALPTIASRVCDFSINIFFKIAAIIFFTPAFLLPSVVVVALASWVGRIYLKAQASVKREMSNAKAPVVGLIGAVSTGVVSVRAYSAQDQFAEILMTRIDHYSRSARIFYNLQRWMAMRTETLAGIFCASLAWYLVYFTNYSASEVGFVLNLAVMFSTGMVWLLLSVNELEAESNSLERLESYLRIDQETQLGEGNLPPAHWPSSGELRVENLTASYSSGGPEILHGLTFQIRSGERIGVVGRTGSGKSTLTLALLRCIPTSGQVLYDGMLTSALNLDALRSQITIIPQTPELLSGTLRQNLDPFEEHDDQILNNALESAGLASLQEELDIQDRVNLDTLIASGGSNLSVGQRQVLNLARAIVRQSKLLILDEATSAIDHKTDSIIQESLRKKYRERGDDATIITVAHRLQTVMDMDRIMVLDAGRIVEFDSPAALLRNEHSQFRGMVECASDKHALLALVKVL
ncbi:hypothetical protein D9757_003539 [Collybiopsis confluens]|uniref:P-loop containing nucleoside triphosphate hydrolase protein n=1 Tax=Collybiopsis confluens TaxID=2823264 RepID=A0A8H5HTG6_9AGAR|nr:hypothetical protein D9757_003539 [Collybiopsis confluens]